MSLPNTNENSKPYSAKRFNKRNIPNTVNLKKCYGPTHNNFHYYSSKYNYRYRWGSWRNRRKNDFRRPEKEPPKSPSSFSGTEEHTLKKIQETSDMIKKKLMMPEGDDTEKECTYTEESQRQIVPDGSNLKNVNGQGFSGNSSKTNMSYNMNEIHNKIITHLTNLSHSKKMNLIFANSSEYDGVIQRIHKQKRLELSKALRDMCSNSTVANSELLTTIIPDIGIKIEDLPLEMIQELSNTLDLNLDNTVLDNLNESVNINCDVYDYSTISCSNVLESDQLHVENKKNNESTENKENDVHLMEVQEDNNVCVKQERIHTEFDIKDSELNICQNIEQSDNLNIKHEIESVFDYFVEEKYNISTLKSKPEINHADSLNPEINDIQNHNIQSISPSEMSLQNTTIQKKSKLRHNQSRSIGQQTQNATLNSVATQTPDVAEPHFDIDKNKISNLNDAIHAMFQIDNEIMRLTQLRQSIFLKIQNSEDCTINNEIKNTLDEQTTCKGTRPKKRKTKHAEGKTGSPKQKYKKSAPAKVAENAYYKEAISFEKISEKVLVIKLINDTLVVATEGGKLLCIDPYNGTINHIINVSEAPITSLVYWKTKKEKHNLFVGSLMGGMHQYNLETKQLVHLAKLNQCVQCLEVQWKRLFIGTTTGNLVRFSPLCHKIEFEENISPSTIMVLKAAQEGARRVLLVGTRNAPVCIRDAMSGLHLRTLTELVTPTVYSLILERSMVYCGTTFHDLLVFSFNDGSLIHRFEVTNSKGICCMKIVGDLLYASCHDGNIYVYNIESREYVGTIPGPGGGILAMDVVKNIVIVGTLSLHFKSILIPEHILEQNKI